MAKKRAGIILAILIAVLVAVVSFDWWWLREQRDRELMVLINEMGQVGQMGAPLISPDTFKRFGKRAVPELQKVLESEESNELAKCQALMALGEIGEPSVFPVLKRWANSQNAAIRNAAITALGSLRTPEAVSFLISLLDKPHARHSAIAALGKTEAIAARRPLLHILHRYLKEKPNEQGKIDDATACAAAEALGYIGGESVVSVLRSLLERKPTRYSAAKALARLGDARAFDILVKEFLGARDNATRQCTIKTIISFGKKAHRHIIRALKTVEEPHLLADLIIIAGQQKISEAIQPIANILNSKQYPLSVREHAAQALGNIGTANALQVLFKAVPQAPSELRKSLEFALAKLETPEAEDVFIKALESKEPSMRQLAARLLGLRNVKRAVPMLIKALKDKDAGTRIQAVKALGIIGDPSALPAVEKLVNDPDPNVRRKAQMAATLLKSLQRQ